MSSRPGYTLESYVAWNFNIAVVDRDEVNFSLGLAEIFGSIPSRPRLSAEQLSKVVAPFEEHRERVEDLLLDFDDDNQSWRTYAGCAFDCIPQDVFDKSALILNEILAE